MATVAAPPVQRIELFGRDWKEYEAFVQLQGERRAFRVSFDRGWLEVMVLSLQHERPVEALAAIIETVANEFDIEYEPGGSPTIQRPHLERGFEPDASFYFREPQRIRGAELAPSEVPAPDLVIEVDITSDSRGRFPIFAAVGVPEVWRYADGQLQILTLSSGEYRQTTSSQWLPILTTHVVQRFLDEWLVQPRNPWLRSIRQWAREQRA